MKVRALLTAIFMLILIGGFVLSPNVAAQSTGQDDVFVPIGKYLSQGDSQKLSLWFASSLEVGVLDKNAPATSTQARQILQNFFQHYPPRAFRLSHTTSDRYGKYAIGVLSAGGESFFVSIYATLNVKNPEKGFEIQQILIAR